MTPAAPEPMRAANSRAFFDLQLQFADKVALLAGLPLADALLAYTNLYIRFGLGRQFDPAHPDWREYLAGIREGADNSDWTYRYYLARPNDAGPPAVVASSGCFSYAQLDNHRIRIHFGNAEADGRRPLGAERAAHRLEELRALFEHVARTQPAHTSVVGVSWLYNLAAYRRLFPAAYLATAREVSGRFRYMPLWGQFLDRHGAVKPDMAAPFLERVGRLSDLARLDQCFPFQVISLEAPATAFHDFYQRQPG